MERGYGCIQMLPHVIKYVRRKRNFAFCQNTWTWKMFFFICVSFLIINFYNNEIMKKDFFLIVHVMYVLKQIEIYYFASKFLMNSSISSTKNVKFTDTL